MRASGCVHREPVMDLTAVMWVSPGTCATHAPLSSFRLHVWPCAAKGSALGGLSLSLLYFSRYQDAHLCAAIVATLRPSIPLPSYVRNESAVKLGEFLFTGDQLDRFREPPARAYNPECEGVGKDKFDGAMHEVG